MVSPALVTNREVAVLVSVPRKLNNWLVVVCWSCCWCGVVAVVSGVVVGDAVVGDSIVVVDVDVGGRDVGVILVVLLVVLLLVVLLLLLLL